MSAYHWLGRFSKMKVNIQFMLYISFVERDTKY